MIGIYKITNQINNKIYIGQSQNISQRWKSHRSHYQKDDYPIYRAMRKYGLENFTFEVIEECTLEELNDREKYWIKYYNSHNLLNGYNLTDGGNTSCPVKLSKQQVLEIITLLSTSVLSQEEIGKKFNVSQRTISSINIGETWVQENIKYPIRRNGIVNQSQFNKDSIENFFQQKQVNNCIICGEQINKASTYCSICAKKQQRVVKERPNREELKNLIRTLSFVQIGKNYNVSDNAIRKWCKLEQLPYKKTEINKISDEDWKLI